MIHSSVSNQSLLGGLNVPPFSIVTGKLEEKQTKETIKKYKNVDSGASLADILGPAMQSEKKPKKSKK